MEFSFETAQKHADFASKFKEVCYAYALYGVAVHLGGYTQYDRICGGGLTYNFGSKRVHIDYDIQYDSTEEKVRHCHKRCRVNVLYADLEGDMDVIIEKYHQLAKPYIPERKKREPIEVIN